MKKITDDLFNVISLVVRSLLLQYFLIMVI